RRARAPGRAAGRSGPPRVLGAGVVPLFGAIVVLPLTAVVLAAFNHPSSGLVPTTTGYRQSGTFSYGAKTAPGPAYQTGLVPTGSTVFLELVRRVDVRFAYRFASAAPHAVHGTAWLDATLDSSAGWHRTLRLTGPQPVAHGRTVLRAKLDLGRLIALTQRVEEATQVSAGYTLTLEPHVRVHGTVGTTPLATTYHPTLPFSLD